MKPHYAIKALCLLLVCVTVPAAADSCFDPPSDPMSQKPTDWRRLVDWAPPTADPQIVELQRIADGRGENINLDYYAFTFKKHPSRTIKDVFLRTRKRFEVYARGSTRDSNQYFGAYRAASGQDPVQQQNSQTWASTAPAGSLMTFVLASVGPPVLVMKATLDGFVAVLEQGDVLATCATDLDFIFTTARTKKNGWHPVNGNRGFGMRDNGDGTWSFYTMAADRRAPYVGGRAAEGAAYVRNATHPFESNKPDPSEELYLKGHEFWLLFFGAMKTDFESQGMQFVNETINSHRYPYPLATP